MKKLWGRRPFLPAAVLIGCFLPLFLGCAATGVPVIDDAIKPEVVEKPDLEEPQLPKRVAVLPFFNAEENPEASHAVRRVLFNNFASKHYFSLHIDEVDRRLALANLKPGWAMTAEDIRLLADTLGVDGLLFGEVTHYDKIYAGVYSQVAVGARMQFMARDGREIWRGEHVTRKHDGGLPTTPVGLIMQVVASAMHIRDINLYRASDELGREFVAKIPEPKRLDLGSVGVCGSATPWQSPSKAPLGSGAMSVLKGCL